MNEPKLVALNDVYNYLLNLKLTIKNIGIIFMELLFEDDEEEI
ncbi:MAG: hypothetical protein ABF685_00430 [Clostridium saccharoperbutylacetonicum]